MPPSRTPLPRETVRDLLGIARALYRAELAAGGNPVRLQELVEIGKLLADALELSARTEPDTIGHRAAWSKAQRATAALGAFVADDMPLAPVLRATAAKLRG